jgi:K+-sensing histidine kinase KdpD
MLRRILVLLNPTSLLTTVLCGGLALGMSMLCRGHAVGGAVPVIFLLALVPVTVIAGRMASLLAAIVASFIFAVFLFEPYGSLAIRSAVDRLELLCFGLAAIGMLYFSPSTRRHSTGSVFSPFSEGSATMETSDLETWIAIVVNAVGLMAIISMLLYLWK